MNEPISLNLDAAITADFPAPLTAKEAVFINSLAYAADLSALDTQRIGRTGTRGSDEAAYDTLDAPSGVPMEDRQ